MASDQVGDLLPAGEPAGRKPPVGMNQVRFEARHRRAAPPARTPTESRGSRALPRATGASSGANRRCRPPARVARVHSGNGASRTPAIVLHGGSTRRVRGEHFHLVTTSGGPFGDPLDEGTGGVAEETRIVVGDRQNAERPIGRGHRDTIPRTVRPRYRGPAGRARPRPPGGSLRDGPRRLAARARCRRAPPPKAG